MKTSIISQLPDQEAVLNQFLYQAIFVLPDDPPPDPTITESPELARYVSDWGKPDDHAVFAVQNCKVIGACWSRCFPPDAPGYGTLSPAIPELSIAVLPEYRNMGIGSQLLGALIAKISSIYPAVSLSVSVNNPARKLYERHGFSFVERTGDSIVMKKQFETHE